MQKGVWFGLIIMAMVVLTTIILLPSPANITQGHLGLLMLALIVVGIMLGFPTAFTLMGIQAELLGHRAVVVVERRGEAPHQGRPFPDEGRHRLDVQPLRHLLERRAQGQDPPALQRAGRAGDGDAELRLLLPNT